MTQSDEMKKRNRRLGWILASVALLFFLGFFARTALFGF